MRGGGGDGRNGTFLCQLYLQYLASEVSIWIYHVFFQNWNADGPFSYKADWEFAYDKK